MAMSLKELKIYKHDWYIKNKEKHKTRMKAWYENNKEHHTEKTKEYKQLNKEKVNKSSLDSYHRGKSKYSAAEKKVRYKNGHLRKEFNITMKEYNMMLERQNNVCAICGEFEKCLDKNGNVKFLSVDHDHSNNEIRSLLCLKCNTGIAFFKDSPSLLFKAMTYILAYKVAKVSSYSHYDRLDNAGIICYTKREEVDWVYTIKYNEKVIQKNNFINRKEAEKEMFEEAFKILKHIEKKNGSNQRKLNEQKAVFDLIEKR